MPGIGLLNEGPLHAALKTWYAQPGDRFEVAVEGFVVDIVRDDLLLEIQTGNIASIKPKLANLVRSHRMRLIYPIAQEKWITRLATDNRDPVARRKSPKRGRVEDLFWGLVGIGQLLSNPNLSLEVVMIKEEETRRYVGKRRWRKGGWGVEERRLLEVVDRRRFDQSADWLAFLPAALDSFTTSDLAEATGVRRELAQRMAYCLRHMGVVELIGKQGRANLYRADARLTSNSATGVRHRRFLANNGRCGAPALAAARAANAGPRPSEVAPGSGRSKRHAIDSPRQRLGGILAFDNSSRRCRKDRRRTAVYQCCNMSLQRCTTWPRLGLGPTSSAKTSRNRAGPTALGPFDAVVTNQADHELRHKDDATRSMLRSGRHAESGAPGTLSATTVSVQAGPGNHWLNMTSTEHPGCAARRRVSEATLVRRAGSLPCTVERSNGSQPTASRNRERRGDA